MATLIAGFCAGGASCAADKADPSPIRRLARIASRRPRINPVTVVQPEWSRLIFLESAGQSTDRGSRSDDAAALDDSTARHAHMAADRGTRMAAVDDEVVSLGL